MNMNRIEIGVFYGFFLIECLKQGSSPAFAGTIYNHVKRLILNELIIGIHIIIINKKKAQNVADDPDEMYGRTKIKKN